VVCAPHGRALLRCLFRASTRRRKSFAGTNHPGSCSNTGQRFVAFRTKGQDGIRQLFSSVRGAWIWTLIGAGIDAFLRIAVLVMLEQFSGIGYVAVVVSRLIGMTLVQQEKKEIS
jgi:hypothetical protein